MSEDRVPNSNPQGSRGRPFSPYFHVQPDAGPPGFHNPGNMQGLHNFRGDFNVPYDMQGPLFGQRNPTMNNPGNMQGQHNFRGDFNVPYDRQGPLFGQRNPTINNPGNMQGQPNFRGDFYDPYDMQEILIGPRNPTMNNPGNMQGQPNFRGDFYDMQEPLIGQGNPTMNNPGNMQGQHHFRGDFNVPYDMQGPLFGQGNPTMNNLGNMQGHPNFRGDFNVPYDMQETLIGPRNPTINNNAFSGVPQAGGSHLAPNYFPVPQTNAHIVGNQGYPMFQQGNLPYNVPGMGVDHVLRHSAPHITSHPNLAARAVSGNLNVHEQNMMMGGSGVFQQGSSGSRNLNVREQNRMMGGTDVFQRGSLQKQGVVSSVQQNPTVQQNEGSLQKQVAVPSVQQNQEVRIEAEDFPHLPGFKETQTSHRPQQQQPHTPSASGGIGVQNRMMGGTGVLQQGSLQKQGVGPSVQQNPRVQQNQDSLQKQGVGPNVQQNPRVQQNQDSLQKQGVVPSAQQSPGVQQNQDSLQKQVVVPSVQQNQAITTSLRPQQQQPHTPSASGSGPVSNQSQPHQNQMPAAGQSSRGDDFGLRGLLSIIKSNDPDLKTLALGLDLTGLGLDMNSKEKLYPTFDSPWPYIPPCYNASERPIGLDGLQLQNLSAESFRVFKEITLFYTFYSMPQDKAQLYAANELYNRGWMYLTEKRSWVKKVKKTKLVEKTREHARGSFHRFDHEEFKIIREDNFVLYKSEIEPRPVLPQ